MTTIDASPFALSSFARDAIREKAARELTALRSAVAACDDLATTRRALVDASSALTSFLGGLGAIAADGATIARAKKLRKLMDEAREVAEAIADAVDLEERRATAIHARDQLLADLAQLGIAVDAPPEQMMLAVSPGIASVAAVAAHTALADASDVASVLNAANAADVADVAAAE